ncbi:hypothetical protein BO71DRAFT_396646 [Aspergillus ellipticus CBS 707.79]|uniref:AA1-like domain-containing protein n=1 Tax=Aspergillus ellipticus CBS 707.79 TaxID=1448320 RepID=A0A319DHE7_9EURO|nr:hypothetical protein BO71DRAFT_396646 [Aspergillus ellipticus CBS 707.79]
MKFATLTTLLIAAAATTQAVPTAKPKSFARALKPFLLQDVTAKILSDVDFATLTLTLIDQNVNNTTTSCEWWWHPDEAIPETTVVSCTNTNYELNFPDTTRVDIEDFVLRVETTASAALQESGDVSLVASAQSLWTCQSNVTAYIKEQCSYNGVVEVPV